MASHRKKKSIKERCVLAFVTLLFLSVAAVGAVHCLIVPPEPDVQEIVLPASSETEQTQAEETELPRLTRRDSCYTILVCGTDDDNGGCDTNILVCFDAANTAVHCVSLPRDTLLDVSWSVKKLNNAYNHGGMDGMAEQVSYLLGIPVDFTVRVDLQAFRALVDAIGGVYFDVPVDMDYDDPTQNLHIHISKGYQLLDGQNALGVVRFRKNNDGTGYATADIGRIGTQQKFLQALASQTLVPSNLDKVSVLANIFFTYVETDLSLGNLAWMGTTAIQKIGMENIHFHTLPGDGAGYYKGVSYYTLDPEAVLEMVNLYLNPYEQDLTMEDLHILSPN